MSQASSAAESNIDYGTQNRGVSGWIVALVVIAVAGVAAVWLWRKH